MRLQRTIFLVLALALAPLSGWSVDTVVTNPNTPAQTEISSIDPAARLSAPVRDVVKMAHAGVPEDVIKAYVENSSSTFNLSSENIIHLQENGISGPVTTAMLKRDKSLQDKSTALVAPVQAPSAGQQPQVTSPQASYPYAANQPANGYAATPANYYSGDVAPYGYGPGYYPASYGYGWGWPTYISFGFYGYPWRYRTYGYGHGWHYPSRSWYWGGHGGFVASHGFSISSSGSHAFSPAVSHSGNVGGHHR